MPAYDDALTRELASLEKRVEDAERFLGKPRGTQSEDGATLGPIVIVQSGGEQALND